MTALSETVTLLLERHAAIVAAYELATAVEQEEYIAAEALRSLAIDPAAAALEAGQLPSVRLALDVAAWRWVEVRTAMLFDFSADGGSYQRSQLLKNATLMRRKAEDAAAAAGLTGFGWPDVIYERITPSAGDEWRRPDVPFYTW